MKHIKTISLALAVITLFIFTGCSAETKSASVMTPPQVTPNGTSEATALPSKLITDSPVTDSPVQNSDKQTDIKVYLNGNKLSLKSQSVDDNGSIMLPIAEISQSFSHPITCETSGDTLTMHTSQLGNEIVITAGQINAKINGSDVAMKAAAIKDSSGTILVEMSAFKQLLNADATYKKEFSTVYITESGLC